MFQKNSTKSKDDQASNKAKPERSKPAPREDRRSRKPIASSSDKPSSEHNVILSDVEIKGTVKFQNDVLIDGHIEGEIISNGCVTIGAKAVVKAEIKSKKVVVEGKVEGNINASDRLEINEQAEVRGDITSAVLAMQAGAVLLGKTTIGAAPKSATDMRNTDKQDSSKSDEQRPLAKAS